MIDLNEIWIDKYGLEKVFYNGISAFLSRIFFCTRQREPSGMFY